MTGLQSVLDGIISYWETELNALEDTDSVTNTSVQLFKEVGRGRIDKVTQYPGAYIWLDRGEVDETYMERTTHDVQFIIRVFAEETSPQELMDELIRLIGKIYDKALTSSVERSMGGSVERRSPRRYLLFPPGFTGIVVNAADIYFEVEKIFRVT